MQKWCPADSPVSGSPCVMGWPESIQSDIVMLCMGKEPGSGRVAPDSSNVYQLSHVYCGEQVGQAAQKL